MQRCYHCGSKAYPEYSLEIDNEMRDFCCFGCQAVTVAIVDGGLDNFYQYRDEFNQKVDDKNVSFLSYDLDEIQKEFVLKLDSDCYQIDLQIGGISCAACAWLIENHLQRLIGVKQVSVNVANYRCVITWDKSALKLSEIFQKLSEIGYSASPSITNDAQTTRKQEERTAILRLGVAGVAMMQVGMVAIALYAGDIQGMASNTEYFLRWVSLCFATPVIVYSARPFFMSAIRSIKLGHINMDVPVSLALSLAFIASVYSTIAFAGEVYFDSVAMFTFFLLLGRFLEMRARHSHQLQSENLSQLLPFSVERMVGSERELIPIKSLSVGDVVWVPAGEVIPCDGMILDGASAIDESLLTGESVGELKQIGDMVLAGSINGEAGLSIKAKKVGPDTGLAEIERLVNQAAADKPKFVGIADRLASRFVMAVILIAILVGGYWLTVAPERALWIVLSILVVTCPCALSLATPAALTAGVNGMRKKGLLIRSQHVLEALASIKCVIFDKTGTLTKGELSIADCKLLTDSENKASVLEKISALEKSSAHPIAKAFRGVPSKLNTTNVNVVSGLGVEGRIQNEVYRFGKLAFCTEILPSSAQLEGYPSDGLWQLLVSNREPLAWVLLEDTPRSNISSVLNAMYSDGVQVSILSGDREENVRQFSKQNQISNYHSAMLPADKLAHVKTLQNKGNSVLMVGDGINDVPVLSGADVSVAMASATQLARTRSDCVLLNENLSSLVKAFDLAKGVKITIRQNLAWAIGYNIIALPAAAMGYIPPYLAAIGMSLSSLVVVLNALRLEKRG